MGSNVTDTLVVVMGKKMSESQTGAGNLKNLNFLKFLKFFKNFEIF